jgi:arylsulfatase A-like enzyme
MENGKPNILFIFTDQHRLSALGAYGETQCKTPNIDALASEGILFRNAYTTCPVCSPARASVMTGQYPHAHGVTTNIHEAGCSVHELEDRPQLLSRCLENAGYSLGYSGKWHLGSDSEKSPFGGSNKPSLPKDVGFEGQNFPGHGGGGFDYPEYKAYLKANGFEHKVREWSENTKLIWPAGQLEGPVESTVPYFLAQNSIELMDEFAQRGKPFFLWHNFWGPHGPFYVPEKYIDMYRDVEIPEWSNYNWPSSEIPGPHQSKIHPWKKDLKWDDWAMMIRYYYAFATLIDDQIGRMVVHMKKKGLLENTMIIFSSDHGQTLGSHGGLVDKGWHHFEETHRIPMIMRFPDARHAGKVIEEFASLADVYPTFLDMAGVDCKGDGIHGRSLMPLVAGDAVDWRDCVVTEFNGLGNSCITQRTLRKGSLKYGYNNTGKCELYDLEKDPDETRNLIGDPAYKDSEVDLAGSLLRWMEQTNDRAVRRFKFSHRELLGIEVSPVI